VIKLLTQKEALNSLVGVRKRLLSISKRVFMLIKFSMECQNNRKGRRKFSINTCGRNKVCWLLTQFSVLKILMHWSLNLENGQNIWVTIFWLIRFKSEFTFDLISSSFQTTWQFVTYNWLLNLVEQRIFSNSAVL